MKLESAVAVAAIQAAIKRLGIAVAAKTLPISMAVELGHFLIEREFFGSVDVYDGTGAVDELMFDYFKTLTDNPSVAEDAVYAFNKVLADVPGLTDIEVFDFYKSLANVSTATDHHTASVAKPLTDTVASLGDTATAYVKKVKASTAAVAEADYKDFYKALTEAPSLMDAIDTVSFFKNTQDETGFTDAETLSFAKFLFDTVGATDDVDGAASVLDDQEMQYFKGITQVASATEVFVRVVAYVRAYTDGSGVVDDSVLNAGKVVANNTLFTDLRHKDFGKLTDDTTNIGDALELQVTLAPFTDAANVSDSAYLTPNKVILDSTSLTDAGSLRSQGYSDFTYFAEDFVGASRTF